jgi:hypothetical protein
MLPEPPSGKKWCRVVDTNLAPPKDFTPGGNAGACRVLLHGAPARLCSFADALFSAVRQRHPSPVARCILWEARMVQPSLTTAATCAPSAAAGAGVERVYGVAPNASIMLIAKDA